MSFSLSSRALLRGMLAGAAVFTGTACHRSDRAESGRENSAAVVPDTSNVAKDTSSNVAQPSGGGAAAGAVSDTARTSARPSGSAQLNTPRAQTAAPSDKDAAGYRSMERDTTNVASQRSDSARVTAETADVSSVSSDTSMSQTSIGVDSAASDASAGVADTSSAEMTGAADTNASADATAAGYAEMARDTSSVVDQVDTAAAANEDVAVRATTDTSSQANADVTAESGLAAAEPADTTGNAGAIRPPEDSTEILGNVTTDEAADETADEQVVRPEDRATVTASETPTDEVGAAAIGGDVTGTEAVALMSREGVRCAVVDPEGDQAVRWDMSNTPVALNPCGMGSMILSRIWTRIE
jgi:hypothetical protein